MRWVVFWLAVVLALVAVGWFYWWSTKPVVQQELPPPPTELAEDVYPLYPDAQWGVPTVETIVIGTTTYSGASVTSTSIPAGMDPGGIFTPFEKFYDQKLKALGWSTANDLAAGGHVGGQMGYRKGGQIILTRFSIEYHNKPQNAPSECPCDVTLSLFSSI